MSNRNNEGAEIAFAAALIGFCAIFIFYILLLIGFVIACALTGIAIAAWNKPAGVGFIELTPQEARFFICSGIVGTAAVPSIVWLASRFFGFEVIPELWPQIFCCGYTVGSLGLTISAGSHGLFDEPAVEPPAPPEVIRPPEPRPEPFRFARWDDEDPRP